VEFGGFAGLRKNALFCGAVEGYLSPRGYRRLFVDLVMTLVFHF